MFAIWTPSYRKLAPPGIETLVNANSAIAVTSPHPELTSVIHQVSSQYDEKPLVVEAVLEDAVDKVRRLLSRHRIEAIISRGGTAQLLKQALSVPVITAEATRFEILQALWRAKRLSTKMAYITYEHLLLDSDELAIMEEIINCPIRQLLFSNMEQLREQIHLARQEGIEVAVGGGIIGVELAQRAGMHGILVFASRSAVRRAFERAHDLVELRRNDRRQAQQLEAIIEQTFQGVIARDGHGTVTIFNPVAEKAFGISREKVLGTTAEELARRNPAIAALIDGQEATDALHIHPRGKLVFNRTHIHDGLETCGSIVTFQDVTKIQSLEQRIRKELHRKGLVAKFSLDDMIYRSEVMEHCLVRARQYAAPDSTVLISGESGTGKELIAQGIHNASPRRGGPFLAINCAALPEALLESELFGHEEGSFTGARKGGKAGLFELAHKGTILLDEIGKMPLNLQGRLLRVLQEREVMRVGGDRVVPVDVRVLAATNKNLADEMANGNFLEDLYFRLNVLSLRIPSLRERTGDISELVRHFLKRHGRRDGHPDMHIPPVLLERMKAYHWPGNVRELESQVEKYAILHGIGIADQELDAYLEEMSGVGASTSRASAPDGDRVSVSLGTLERMQRELIGKLDTRLGGNKTLVAKALGISRTTLWKKMSDDR